MKPLIITDSNCDLSPEYIKNNNIPVIPFYFHLQGKNYEDNFGKSIDYKEFYNQLREGEISTSTQITPYIFEEYFRNYISKGYSIIYIGFSSALSETNNNAIAAKKTILKNNNSADITVIDTRSATSGQGLLVYYACEMLKQSKTKEEIVNWIEDNKLKVNIWFTVDSLEHLKRGGRLSATSAALGTMIEIKPVLEMNRDGKLIMMKKVRKRKKSIKSLLEEVKNRVIDPEEQTLFINHGDCLEDAEYLKTLIVSILQVKNVIINYIGPVIGTHAGPGVLSIAFIGKERE